MKKIAIVNGPNLNRLGVREPEIYGSKSLADLENQLLNMVAPEEAELEFFQSNHEGSLIDFITGFEDDNGAGIILNPGALTHTSLALRDAIAGLSLPVVEVHISNIYRREKIRQHSLTAPACVGVISGLGFAGYSAALNYLLEHLDQEER
ncbi:MAG: type II 3-dehydroquinate dehydratase [Opitutales bacterium]|nr:type II 3-dehydroquinate dehydratase [Opitutales bacterium]MCH8539662.1 type II 3-dehydroquinate dehydratase [Opitutales bacterium]